MNNSTELPRRLQRGGRACAAATTSASPASSVGTVSDISLEGTHVRVDFDVDSTWIGDQQHAPPSRSRPCSARSTSRSTRSATRRSTPTRRSRSTARPRRTTSPPPSRASAARSARSTAPNWRAASPRSPMRSATPRRSCAQASTGSRGLSQTIASRDNALGLLVQNTRRITAVLSRNNPHIDALVRDGNLLLRELAGTKRGDHHAADAARRSSAPN